MSYIVTILIGALCVLAIYVPVRWGNIPLAILLIVAVSSTSGAIAQAISVGRGIAPALRHSGVFVAGALAGETISFAFYYLSYGYDDPKLSVGIAIAFLEFIAISVIGGLCVLASWFALCRLNRR